MLFSIAPTPMLRCAHVCPTALPMECWLAYLLVRVLLQVAGSRESALKPSQVPPTPCREERGRLMSLPGSVPLASRPGSDSSRVLAVPMGNKFWARRMTRQAWIWARPGGGGRPACTWIRQYPPRG